MYLFTLFCLRVISHHVPVVLFLIPQGQAKPGVYWKASQWTGDFTSSRLGIAMELA